MEITAQMVKQLREMTGVGPKDCKAALEEFQGDMNKAANHLREKGLAKAIKKAGRAANEGVIEVYKHHNSRIAVIVEVNCETDFVAKTDKFKEFAREVALHIANLAPQYVNRDEVPADVVAAEQEVQRRRAKEEGKPDNIVEKMLEGRMNSFFAEVVLMEQPWIKDDKLTIEDLRKHAVADVGENVVIRRFARYELGEQGDEKAED